MTRQAAEPATWAKSRLVGQVAIGTSLKRETLAKLRIALFPRIDFAEVYLRGTSCRWNSIEAWHLHQHASQQRRDLEPGRSSITPDGVDRTFRTVRYVPWIDRGCKHCDPYLCDPVMFNDNGLCIRLYKPGVNPVLCKKTVVRWLWLANPAIAATWASGRSDRRSICRDRLTRRVIT